MKDGIRQMMSEEIEVNTLKQMTGKEYGIPLPAKQQVDYTQHVSWDELNKIILQYVIDRCPIRHRKWGGNVDFHLQIEGNEASIPVTVRIWKEDELGDDRGEQF